MRETLGNAGRIRDGLIQDQTEMALLKSWLLTRVVQDCPVLCDAKGLGKLPMLSFYISNTRAAGSGPYTPITPFFKLAGSEVEIAAAE
jgi:hypothetical protein